MPPTTRLIPIPEVTTLKSLQFPTFKTHQRERRPSPPQRNGLDLRALLRRIQFEPIWIKNGLIVFSTFCWVLVLIVRSVELATAPAEHSALAALAANLQHGAWSGRDFHSPFGPGAQWLAWFATRATFSDSPLDAQGLTALLFGSLAAVIMGLALFVVDRINWKQVLTFYAFSFALNFFDGTAQLNTSLLLLCAALAYRIVAAESGVQQVLWAAATGVAAFLSQLVMFELGLFACATVFSSIVVGAILHRSAMVLVGAQTFLAVIAALNLALVALFKLTSPVHTLMFDYHSYGLEILRGQHLTAGTPWGLPVVTSAVLVAGALYLVFIGVAAAREAVPRDAALCACFTIAALVWLKGATVQSDATNLVVAFTPVVVAISLLATRVGESLKSQLAWAIVAAGLVVVWPALGPRSVTDLYRVVKGEVSVPTSLQTLRSVRQPLPDSVRRGLQPADLVDRSNIPLMAFPSGTPVVVGLKRPLFSPLLEGERTTTQFLEQHVVQALHRQRQSPLEILLNDEAAQGLSPQGVQGLTYRPVLFDYMYRNFELTPNSGTPEGLHLLRAGFETRNVVTEPLRFAVLQRSIDSGVLQLSMPSTCGLIRVEAILSHDRNAQIFRPAGLQLRLKSGSQQIWQGALPSLDPGNVVASLITPLPKGTLHRVFGQEPVAAPTWDVLEYESQPTDFLGSPASSVEILNLHCLDPQRFVSAPPAS